MFSPKKTTPTEWERCIEGRGTYQLTYGKLQLCGARENQSCPYLHPMQAPVRDQEGYHHLHLCSYRKMDEDWKRTVEDLKTRWDWVMAALSEQGKEYSFSVTPKAAENLRERRTFFPQYSLDQLIHTAYYEIGGAKYGVVYSGREEVTTGAIRRLFKKTRKSLSGEYQTLIPIANRREYTPPSMERMTLTPFPTTAELAELEQIFIHDAPGLDRQEVLIPTGGRGVHARRISLKLPYHTIFDLLVAKTDSRKIIKATFW
ncbi:hypothetical protein HYT55_05505 [Candidatus Woesearchaeota archaeon]|nr:hypothetical protein [Candidatus Woesearchaeota archaeon]